MFNWDEFRLFSLQLPVKMQGYMPCTNHPNHSKQTFDFRMLPLFWLSSLPPGIINICSSTGVTPICFVANCSTDPPLMTPKAATEPLKETWCNDATGSSSFWQIEESLTSHNDTKTSPEYLLNRKGVKGTDVKWSMCHSRDTVEILEAWSKREPLVYFELASLYSAVSEVSMVSLSSHGENIKVCSSFWKKLQPLTVYKNMRLHGTLLWEDLATKFYFSNLARACIRYVQVDTKI